MVESKRKSGRERPVSVEGVEYPNVSVAARTLGLPIPTVFTRIYSNGSKWESWFMMDGKETPTNRNYNKAFLNWAVYTLEHIPSGKIYVGMTGNAIQRRSLHKHYLKNDKHPTPALQALFNRDPDWDNNWRWTTYVVKTKEDAESVEQTFANTFADQVRLLNQSTNTRSPITHNLRNPVVAEKRRIALKKYNLRDPAATAARGEKMAKERWSDAENRKAWSGAGNPFAKAVTIDGVRYGSVKDAVKAVGVCEKTIRTRARSEYWDNYHFDA